MIYDPIPRLNEEHEQAAAAGAGTMMVTTKDLGFALQRIRNLENNLRLALRRGDELFAAMQEAKGREPGLSLTDLEAMTRE